VVFIQGKQYNKLINMAVADAIPAFVTILVGVVLVPVLVTTIADANVTGNTGIVLALIPLFFALGILVSGIKGLLG
jgi:hypothetical protein